MIIYYLIQDVGDIVMMRKCMLGIKALVDIWRRPEEEIRGSKRLWTAAAFVNFIGPLSYFSFGRRR